MSLRRVTLAPDAGKSRDRVVIPAILAVALAVAGIVLSIWRPTAPTSLIGTPLDRFAPEVLATVRSYAEPRYLALTATTALSVLVPFWFVATGRGRRVTARLVGSTEHPGRRSMLVAVTVVAVASLARLPVALPVAYFRDREWGFAAGSVWSWLWEWSVTVGGRLLAYGVGVGLLVWAVRRWPRSWPFRLTLAGTVLVAAVALLHPMLIQPLTLTTQPLEPGSLRSELQAVLDRAGEPELDILVGDASRRTTRVNAFVSGLGPSRQLVLYDTLLELPQDHVAYVVAHELAHRQHQDVPRGVTLSAAGLLVGLLLLAGVLRSAGMRAVVGARGPGDPRLVPLIVVLATVGQLLAAPVAMMVSRRAEVAADHRALELTRDPAAMVASARGFVVRDLSDPAPPAWVRLLFGSHPTAVERIRAAATFAEEEGIELPGLERFRADEADIRHPRIELR